MFVSSFGCRYPSWFINTILSSTYCLSWTTTAGRDVINDCGDVICNVDDVIDEVDGAIWETSLNIGDVIEFVCDVVDSNWLDVCCFSWTMAFSHDVKSDVGDSISVGVWTATSAVERVVRVDVDVSDWSVLLRWSVSGNWCKRLKRVVCILLHV